MFKPWLERVRGTKFYDRFMAVPLIVWFGRGLWNDAQPVMIHLKRIGEGSEDLLGILQMIALAGSAIFCTLLIVILVVRTTPRRRATGVLPHVLAVAGTFLGTSLIYLKPSPLSLPLQAVADLMIIATNVLTVIVLAWLGQSFAIMADARKLVVTGPYALVRHPLYVVEEIGMIAMLIQFASWAALLIVLAHLAIQVARTVFEERVLVEAFPEYADY